MALQGRAQQGEVLGDLEHTAMYADIATVQGLLKVQTRLALEAPPVMRMVLFKAEAARDGHPLAKMDRTQVCCSVKIRLSLRRQTNSRRIRKHSSQVVVCLLGTKSNALMRIVGALQVQLSPQAASVTTQPTRPKMRSLAESSTPSI